LKRSEDKVLTTHVGSLPFTDDERAPTSPDQMRAAVEDVIKKQREVGLDLINEGEYTKGGTWLSFANERLSGFKSVPDSNELPLLEQGRDREEFASFYRYATEQKTLFYSPPGDRPRGRQQTFVCTGPIEYVGHEALRNELEILRASDPGEDAFVTSTTPGSLLVYRRNEFYDTDDEFLIAFAEAMRVEYEAIVAAGFVLQVDDAWINGMWERIGMDLGLEGYREYCRKQLYALNHALRNIPEDRVRYHMCWGSWQGPHVFDLELIHLVDLLLEVKAQAYVIEGANPRHEHEWQVWRDVPLPDGKILVPGVVTHSTNVVEHPELVAQRIERYANVVGKQNVIAGADCGFGGRAHPQIAWAKLRSLTEGARLATQHLGST
jgi:5-methyltetrahydropteroyltriglutamate--homocysteine methyltransferase